MKYLSLFTIFLASVFSVNAYSNETNTEKIVFFRHGEKNADGPELGQINCRGFNRAIKLSKVLVKKFGKPNYIFAPNPSQKIEKKGIANYYLRPLITIEPLAIEQQIPIDISYGYSEAEKISSELLDKKYSGSTIFVSWQSDNISIIARDIYKEKNKDAETAIPAWISKDYDSIFVLTVERAGDEIKSIKFSKDAQNLNKLSDKCPA